MKQLLAFLVSIGILGCGLKKEEQDSLNVSPEEAAVETAIGAISGLVDDQSGESYSAAKAAPSQNIYATVLNLLLPKVQAAAWCSRAIYAACSQGQREATYNSCHPMGLSTSLDGFVRLSYSQAACSLTNNGETVTRTYEDMVQESWMRIIRNASQYRPIAGLAAWICQVTRNACLNELRGLHWEENLDDVESTLEGTDNPAAVLEGLSNKVILEKAFAKLPAQQRTVLVMFIYEELNHSEIAEALAISIGAVKQLIFRSKENLRRYVKDEA